MNWFRRWLAQLKEPKQVGLPFGCWNYGLRCEYIHDSTTGFYGRCTWCGTVYDPPCDR